MLTTIAKEIGKLVLSILITVVYVVVMLRLIDWMERVWDKLSYRWHNRKRRLHISIVK